MPKIQLESTGTKDAVEMLVKITSNWSKKMDFSQLCLPFFFLSIDNFCSFQIFTIPF